MLRRLALGGFLVIAGGAMLSRPATTPLGVFLLTFALVVFVLPTSIQRTETY